MSGLIFEPLSEDGGYASVSWHIEDIHIHREERECSKWTDEQARTFLRENEGIMKDAMILTGWEVISDLLLDDDPIVSMEEDEVKDRLNQLGGG